MRAFLGLYIWHWAVCFCTLQSPSSMTKPRFMPSRDVIAAAGTP